MYAMYTCQAESYIAACSVLSLFVVVVGFMGKSLGQSQRANCRQCRMDYS